MRVALFGGSFDPPHRGHVAIARAAAERFALNKVRFTPAARQPLKPAGSVAGYADRLAMVRLLCDEDGRFEASTADGPRDDGGLNYTIDTLRTLRAEVPLDAELLAIVGADSFLDLRSWRDSDGLLAAARWIVVSRPGFELNALAGMGLDDAQMARVELLEGVAEPASATAVRACLESGGVCDEFLTEPVRAYIRERSLYVSSARGTGPLQEDI